LVKPCPEQVLVGMQNTIEGDGWVETIGESLRMVGHDVEHAITQELEGNRTYSDKSDAY